MRLEAMNVPDRPAGPYYRIDIYPRSFCKIPLVFRRISPCFPGGSGGPKSIASLIREQRTVSEMRVADNWLSLWSSAQKMPLANTTHAICRRADPALVWLALGNCDTIPARHGWRGPWGGPFISPLFLAK